MQILRALIFVFIICSLSFAQTTSDPKIEKKEAATTASTSNSAINDYLNLRPEKRNPVNIPKFAASPVIDGKLDEEIWKSAAVFKDFIQTGPGNNVPPSKETEVYAGYDEKFFYLAFKCFDEKDKIRATMAKRDDVFSEDNVRVWLDTYNDQRRAYVFGFNPFGVQQDGIYTEGQGADFSVDVVMESKGVIEDWGWSVEVKIPFKSLRYVAGKGKLWGFNAARNIDRLNDEFDQWLPDDRNISGFLIKHGKISGLEEIKAERTLEIVPSVTFSETGERKRTRLLSDVNNNGFDPVLNPGGIQDGGRFVNGPIKSELGVNIKYTITPNITLDAAINPDFAEIEADAPVVRANQRFPLFFEEKRPFFLEGKEIFSSPLNVFYSRTIVDPDLAVKLTGKVGKTSFGFLAASDNAPGNYSLDEINDPVIGPRINEFIDKNAFFSVLRVKHDIGKSNNVGFFATARVFPRNRNFVGGFDGTLKLDPKTVMTFQIVGTHSRKNIYDPGADRAPYRTGNGLGYLWSLDHTTDTFGWYAEATGKSSNYRTDSGFTGRTNTNTLFFITRISTKSKPKETVIRFDTRQFVRYRFDWQGREQYWLAGGSFNAQLQGNLFLNGEAGLQHENIYEDEFGPRRNPATQLGGAFFGAAKRSEYQPYFSAGLDKFVNKKVSFGFFVGSLLNTFDFDFGANNKYPRISPAYLTFVDDLTQDPNTTTPYPGLDPGAGRQWDFQGVVNFKPVDPLNMRFEYTKSILKRHDNDQTAFDTNIFTLRSTYQFTRFLFTRLRVDHDTLNSNTSGQFLFGYNPNPGTAFYVGYNDNFNYNGYSPFTNQYEPQFERNSRTFFIRMSYLFRKSF